MSKDHESITAEKNSAVQDDVKENMAKERVLAEACSEPDSNCHGTGPHALEHHPKEPGTTGQWTGPRVLEHHPRESVSGSTGKPPNDRDSHGTGPRPNERTSE